MFDTNKTEHKPIPKNQQIDGEQYDGFSGPITRAGIFAFMGESPLSKDELPSLGKAIGEFIITKYGSGARVLIAHDTRVSSPWINASLQSGLLLYPIALMDANILPQAAVCEIIKHQLHQGITYDFGIIIGTVAPKLEINGIQFVDSQSGDLNLEEIQKLNKLFSEHTNQDVIDILDKWHLSSDEEEDSNLHRPGNEKVAELEANKDMPDGEAAPANEKYLDRNEKKEVEAALKSMVRAGIPSGIVIPTALSEAYIQSILRKFPKKMLKRKKIVIDCGNGTTSIMVKKIFALLGAEVIGINDAPDWFNTNENCGLYYTKDIQQAVIKYQADIGFAFEGSGTHVIAVTAAGEVRNQDHMLAILIKNPRYQYQKNMVGDARMSASLQQHLLQNGVSLLRNIGHDEYVIDKMEKMGLTLGGGQSDGIIMRDHLDMSDGIFTALRLCETIIATNNWALRTFEQLPMSREATLIFSRIAVSTEKEPFATIIAEAQSRNPFACISVIFLPTEHFKDVCSSGLTEPAEQLVKANNDNSFMVTYSIEAPTQEEADLILAELQQKIERAINEMAAKLDAEPAA